MRGEYGESGERTGRALIVHNDDNTGRSLRGLVVVQFRADMGAIGKRDVVIGSGYQCKLK